MCTHAPLEDEVDDHARCCHVPWTHDWDVGEPGGASAEHTRRDSASRVASYSVAALKSRFVEVVMACVESVSTFVESEMACVSADVGGR